MPLYRCRSSSTPALSGIGGILTTCPNSPRPRWRLVKRISLLQPTEVNIHTSDPCSRYTLRDEVLNVRKSGRIITIVKHHEQTLLPLFECTESKSDLRIVVTQCVRCCCINFAPNADNALCQGRFRAAVDPEDATIYFSLLLTVFKGNLTFALSSHRMEHQDSRSITLLMKMRSNLAKLLLTTDKIFYSLHWNDKVRLCADLVNFENGQPLFGCDTPL